MNGNDSEQRLRAWVRSPADRPTPPELRHQVMDIPATAPTIRPKGGTRTMFSAAKLVGIAAAIALFGALMLAVPPGQQQTEPAPAAPASEPGGITTYSGTMKVLVQDRLGALEEFDWGTSHQGDQWTTRWEMSDPRMSGVNTCYTNVYVTDDGGEVWDGEGWLRTYNCRTFTKDQDATWQEAGRGYMDPETMSIHYQSYLVGEGLYEGLFAVMRCDATTYGAAFDCEGAVFEGGLPPTPENAPTEIPEIHGTP